MWLGGGLYTRRASHLESPKLQLRLLHDLQDDYVLIPHIQGRIGRNFLRGGLVCRNCANHTHFKKPRSFFAN